MTYFIISFVVIILLVIVMSLVLKNAVKEVDKKSKSYFVDKLKEYDYLIDEKEKRLSQLEDELEKRKNGLKDNSLSERGPSYDFDTSIIGLLTETSYLDKNIFEINKKIEQKFIINYEDLIKDFLSNVKEDKKYDFCVNLRKKFTPEEIYNIELMLPEERNNYLKNNLTKEEYKVYEIYLSSNKFNMEDFIDYLNRLIELNDPTVVVLVPNNKINYDYIDKKVKTKVSNTIYKGIKILYKNKIYDFSLNEGNVWYGTKKSRSKSRRYKK